MSAAEDALARVLALHIPTPPTPWTPAGETPECAGCREECLYCEGDHDWPCDTYRAATEGGVAKLPSNHERSRMMAALWGQPVEAEVSALVDRLVRLGFRLPPP